MIRNRASGAGGRLLAVYAVASLVPVAILGAVLVRGYQAQALERGRDQGRAQAAVIEEMAIGPALDGRDLARGISVAERTRLQSATDLSIYNGSVSRLRLRTFDGAVAFSDDGTVADSVPTSDPAFQRAAHGTADVTIIATPVAGVPSAIRVMQPVVANSTGQTIGVLELYLPYEAIRDKAQAETQRTITGLGTGLAGLYAVLALISWWTTRSLRRSADANAYQALHDSLTGLPNRQWFRVTVEEALGRRGETGAVVLVDLDHFKEVNDTLGHHAGDQLLQVVAQRLTESLRTDDTVARLGGDEFGLVLPRVSDRASTVAMLQRVRHELAEDIQLGGVALSIQASFGVSFYPEDSDEVEGLLQHADAAMYQGKHGPVGVVVYEAGTDQHPTHLLVVQHELRQAIERDELVLHYQPKLTLRTGQVQSVEALVRWHHPERGLLLPAEFLPTAENSDLIGPLTTWVLRRALRDQQDWRAAGQEWSVAVNVSARNLAGSCFTDHVVALLAEVGGRPEQLQLEVTETALASDPKVAGDSLRALSAHGFAIALDDFGIGFTSLSQLRTLPVSEVKIDRVFVSGLDDNEQDRAIVRSVVELGHSLGCLVTAEGVETKEVAQWLTTAGCDHAQGFLWARAAPWPDIAALLIGPSPSMPPPARPALGATS